MRDYAKVAPQFWTGATGKAIKAAGPEAVIVAMYLMTSPHANMIGVYYLPTLYLAHETGLGVEGATKGLARCIEAGFCTYDHASEYVFVHSMARFQIAESLKPEDNRCKGVRNELLRVPNPLLRKAFFDIYAAAFSLPIDLVPEAPSKALGSQEQEQEQEQESGARKCTRSPPVTFRAWMESLPEGEHAIRPDDPIYRYADSVGISDEIMALAWFWFERTYTGARRAKRYADWRQTFRNAVEGNWGRLWRVAADGAVVLTSEGEALRRLQQAEARREAA